MVDVQAHGKLYPMYVNMPYTNESAHSLPKMTLWLGIHTNWIILPFL